MNVKQVKHSLQHVFRENVIFAAAQPMGRLPQAQLFERWNSIIRIIETTILQCVPSGMDYEHRNEVAIVAQCIECLVFRCNKIGTSLF